MGINGGSPEVFENILNEHDSPQLPPLPSISKSTPNGLKNPTHLTRFRPAIFKWPKLSDR